MPVLDYLRHPFIVVALVVGKCGQELFEAACLLRGQLQARLPAPGGTHHLLCNLMFSAWPAFPLGAGCALVCVSGCNGVRWPPLAG
jgi:hypothetical protein